MTMSLKLKCAAEGLYDIIIGIEESFSREPSSTKSWKALLRSASTNNKYRKVLVYVKTNIFTTKPH